jgi:hypothetical protein
MTGMVPETRSDAIESVYPEDLIWLGKWGIEWAAGKLIGLGSKVVPGLLGASKGAGQIGAIGGKNVPTTTLYRAVSPAELADIQTLGVFKNLGSAEGKYFTTSAEEAAAYAKQAVAGFGDAPYTLIKTEVPNSIFQGLSPVTVDRGIPTWVIPNDRLPGLVPQVIDHFPLLPARLK